jgi:hypothetical protein
VTWSFLPEAEAARFADGADAPWVLANPISEDLKAMRPSLLPGLLSAARRNLDRGATSVRLFEIGRRYLRGEGGASNEAPSLAVVLAGERSARGWATGKAQAFDAFDAKAEALALLAEAGAPVDNLQVMGEAGRSSTPASRRRCALAPRRCWRASACFTLDAQGFRLVRAGRGGRTVPRTPAGKEGRLDVCACALCAARASGVTRLRVPGADRSSGGRCRAVGSRRGQGEHRRGARVRRLPRTGRGRGHAQSRAKSRCNPSTRATKPLKAISIESSRRLPRSERPCEGKGSGYGG